MPRPDGACPRLAHTDDRPTPHRPTQAKHQKRLRTLRNAAREPLKALGVKLTAHGKKVGKERAKFVAGVSDLTQFEAVRLSNPSSALGFCVRSARPTWADALLGTTQLDENRITNVAHAVTESRKSAIEALGSAIHRRTAK